jgi:hypothetical protein
LLLLEGIAKERLVRLVEVGLRLNAFVNIRLKLTNLLKHAIDALLIGSTTLSIISIKHLYSL